MGFLIPFPNPFCISRSNYSKLFLYLDVFSLSDGISKEAVRLNTPQVVQTITCNWAKAIKFTEIRCQDESAESH